MSTDITVATIPERTAADFDVFVDKRVPEIGRAVALTFADRALTAQVMADAVRASYLRWKKVMFDDDPGAWLFSTAIRLHPSPASRGVHSDQDPAARLLSAFSVEERALIIGHHVLGYDIGKSAALIGVPGDRVETVLEAVANRAAQMMQPTERIDVTFQLHEAAQTTPNVRLEIAAIVHDARRTRTRTRVSVGLIGLIVVAVAGSLVAAPRNAGTTASEVATEPRARGPDAAPTSQDDEPAVEAREPAPSAVLPPHLVSVDGDGGFIGIRPDDRDPSLVTVTKSSDGRRWEYVSGWSLAEAETVTRFERLGGRYLAWIQPTERSRADMAKIAVTNDLLVWNVLDLSIDDEVLDGLVYSRVVADAAVSGSDVLVLVRTDVSIDYTALGLIENYSCGSTIGAGGFSVDRCDDAMLEIFGSLDLDALPDRNRFFVSRSGRPFEQVPVPFGPDADLELTTSNEYYGVATAAGLQFAISKDALQWQWSIRLRSTPELVRASSISSNGDIVGLSMGATGPALLFRARNDTTEVVDLTDLIDRQPGGYDVAIESGPAGWIVHLVDVAGESWLLFSTDGLRWRVLDVAALSTTTDHRFFIGDDEILMQSVAETGPALTLVPLDALG